MNSVIGRRQHLRLLAGMTAAALAIASQTASSVADEASITVYPSLGPCGSVVQVAGKGFPPNLDIYVTVTRGGGHHIAPTPTTRSDAGGTFTTAVRVEVADCPSPAGTVAFACPVNSVPICEPKASTPFTVTEAALPLAGNGPDRGRDHDYVLAGALALLGAASLCCALGIVYRR